MCCISIFLSTKDYSSSSEVLHDVENVSSEWCYDEISLGFETTHSCFRRDWKFKAAKEIV